MVQILVVVATTQARTLRAEAEKGFSRTALARELVDPKSPAAAAKRSIGREPGFPDRVAKGNRGPPSRTWDRTVGGDAADPRDGGCGPGKSSLFSATGRRTPESRRAGRGSESGKSAPVSRGVRRAAAVPGKSGGAPCGTGPGRTHDRIGSPRLKASGHRDNVGKGSRQIGSVTSGKGLALKVGPGGSAGARGRPVPLRGTAASAAGPRTGRVAPWPRGGGTFRSGGSPVPRAVDDRFRTDTDRENPTV